MPGAAHGDPTASPLNRAAAVASQLRSDETAVIGGQAPLQPPKRLGQTDLPEQLDRPAQVEPLNALEQLSDRLRLDTSPTWAALLHYSGGRINVHDPAFLLSLPHFSLREELHRTIRYLYGKESTTAVCRFPARYLWLRQAADFPPLPLDGCGEIETFRQRAPIDEVTLTYASENLAQPASMLGHLFLKVSGHDATGRSLEHAISFYTDTGQMWNLPKLLYDSMVVGKRGFFALGPFQDQVTEYVDTEQRSLWEYSLDLSPSQIELLRLHLIELKHTHLTYFFQSYNCSTLINFVLAVANDKVSTRGTWLTPVDVIRRARQAGLIRGSTVLAPNRALIRLLETRLPVDEARLVRASVENDHFDDALPSTTSDEDFARLQLLDSYNTYAWRQDRIPKDTWLRNDERIRTIRARNFPTASLAIADSLNPDLSPPDSQLSVYGGRDGPDSFATLSFLPVSHTLYDDNSHRVSENQLKLFDTAVRLDTRRGRVALERFDLYSIAALTPRDELTGGLAGRFQIGAHPFRDRNLDEIHPFTVEGALGIATRPVRDIDAWLLLGVGAGAADGRFFRTVSLESGLIIREIYSMKTVASVSAYRNRLDNAMHYEEARLRQVKYLTPQFSLFLEGQWDAAPQVRRYDFTFGVTQYF